MKQQIILTALAALPLLSAQAAITYVDAVEGSSGNTFATGSNLSDTTWVGPDDFDANETQWNKRGFANDSTIFQARHSITDAGGDEIPELTTQITGLSDNSYDIWVFFWDAEAENVWNIDAGFNSGSLTTYSHDGVGNTSAPVAASTLSFSNSVVNNESDRDLYGVNIGSATVSGGSDIDVFIDNTVGGDVDNRTWYDGVGYEVIPEPAAGAGLAGIAALGLALLRRRR